MRAILVTEPGGPETLELGEVELPAVGEREIRIRVAAAGVNRADIGQRQGSYPSLPGSPAWPGLEVSGTVIETGSRVTAYVPGDEVCALLGGGGYAEEVVVDERMALPVPAGLSLVEAAALPETIATVWSNLFRAARLGLGDVVLIHGGASGIGTTAIQLAALAGARVATTAGSAAKLAVSADLGAHTLLNYREGDVPARFLQQYPDGADVILDIVGGSALADNIRMLAREGTIVVIGNQSGEPAGFPVGALMAARGRIIGTTLRARPEEEKWAILTDMRKRVWPLIEAGRFRPVIDSEFAFGDVADAHRRLEASEHTGKILLRP